MYQPCGWRWVTNSISRNNNLATCSNIQKKVFSPNTPVLQKTYLSSHGGVFFQRPSKRKDIWVAGIYISVIYHINDSICIICLMDCIRPGPENDAHLTWFCAPNINVWRLLKLATSNLYGEKSFPAQTQCLRTMRSHNSTTIPIEDGISWEMMLMVKCFQTSPTTSLHLQLKCWQS